jgi:pimeloyl-ACP methyl ester carboxylesterase
VTSAFDAVHVSESGRRESPAVVFIHGGGPSGQMWALHLERLGARLHCMAPDLPGFGRSNHLAPLSLAESADLIAELIERRVPSGRAHVVGLSYGGSVVFAILERHANRVDRAVIDGAAVLPVWGGLGDLLVRLGAAAISPIIPTPLLTTLLGPVGLGELGSALRSASPRAFRRAYVEGFTAPASPSLLEVPCPTLLVAGQKETTVRVSDAGLAELMPDAVARFVPALGHAWFAWRHDLHIRTVEAWLAARPLPPELEPEPPSPAATARVLQEIEHRKRRSPS